jgi:hypothetical protein
MNYELYQVWAVDKHGDKQLHHTTPSLQQAETLVQQLTVEHVDKTYIICTRKLYRRNPE